MLQKGDVIGGRYQIEDLIGHGGMSRVFRAKDLTLGNKLWAVKEVDRRAKDPAGRPIEQSLAGEAELLSKLDHPRIVRIVGTEKTEEYIYVIMDYVEGEALDQVIRREGAQNEEDVQKWMTEICDAIGYLHRQNPPIIYRDMKPGNIMLHPDGYVKLIDLGIAKEFRREEANRADTIPLGTPGYAAPEQFGGRASYDSRADIYGIGATMWHLFAGEAPSPGFPLENVREVNPTIGEGFADVIIPKCTEIERSRRYQSCEDLVSDLNIYKELTYEYRAKQKNKVLSFVITGALSILLVLAGFGLLAFRDTVITENYDYELNHADSQVQSNQDAAKEAYIKAIDYKPTEIRPYLGLIACYKEDGKFTKEEKEEFDAVYKANLADLRNKAELSYEIGVLYWYYFSHGQNDGSKDNQTDRIKASADYFENAMNGTEAPLSEGLKTKAQTHRNIAKFTIAIAQANLEGRGAKEMEEEYKEFWTALQELSSIANSSNETPKVRLDAAVFLVNSLETYVDKFALVGIPEDEVLTMLKDAKQVLKALSSDEGGSGSSLNRLETAEDKELCKATLARSEAEVKTKITNAYSDKTIKSN